MWAVNKEVVFTICFSASRCMYNAFKYYLDNKINKRNYN